MPTPKELFGGTLMAPVPDPYAVYRRLRREQPVIAIRGLIGNSFLVTRYDDVLGVLKDADTFSSRGNARGIGLVMGKTILEMEGKEHVRHRRLIAPAFGPTAVRETLPPVIESIAHELIDGFARRGQADLVADFTFTFPMRVVAHIIGVPMEDYAAFHRWGLALISIGDNPAGAFEAAEKITAYLRPLLEDRKRRPRGDLLTTLVHAEVEGERLTDEEVLGFLRLLLPAGAETTYRLIGSALFALLTHPGAIEAVLANDDALDAAIEETLRWESPVQFVSRETTRPVKLAGADLPQGSLVMAALGSANRDESHYEEPDRFVLDRRPADHLAFGFGQHYCVGSHLARLEARIALRALLGRLRDLRLRREEPARIVGLAFRSPDRLPVEFTGG